MLKKLFFLLMIKHRFHLSCMMDLQLFYQRKQMSTTWNCRKKCKIAILLYSFLTAGVHTFVLCNLLGSGTSCYRFLENYLIFSNAVQPVMHSRVHFSINFIKRRNCIGYARIILYYCKHSHKLYTLNFFQAQINK